MAGREAPDLAVIVAFGGRGPAVRIDGGQGDSYLADDVVLKRIDDAETAAWTAGVLTGVREDGFRIARPVRTDTGAWVRDGWSAFERVQGEHRLRGGPWPEVVDLSDRFHHALRQVERPPFLDHRDNVFAAADRIAWGERAFDAPEPLKATFSRLEQLARPVTLPDQVVHADLAGNLLFADGMAPAVIDFSPYWRPAAYATAQVVVDAVLWYDAGLDLTAHAADIPQLEQVVVRALRFRLAIHGLQVREPAPGLRWQHEQVRRDLDRADLLIRWLSERLPQG